MLPTSNCGGKVIRRLFLSHRVYHAIAQAYDGKIYHEKFESEREARAFLEAFDNQSRPQGVVTEKIGN